MGRILIRALAAFVALAGSAAESGAHAEDVFAGKTMTIIVSTGAGGSYYEIAQAFTRNMPKYLPGKPTMIVKAMPGAGNVLATNYLYNIAPKDGTTIGTVNNAIPLHQVLDGRGVHYDASKFNWLGSTGSYNSAVYVWHTAGVKTLEDLRKKTVVLGGTGAGSSIVIFPIVMNNVLGTKFDIVIGYKSVGEIDIAMERGEVQARTGSYTALTDEHPDWLKEHKVEIIAQIGSKRDPAVGNVPLLTEFAKTDEQRNVLKLISSPIALGRPFLAPPGVGKDRVALLRKAFAESMKDKAFLADAAKIHLAIDPVGADELTETVRETIDAPKDVVDKAKAAMVGAKKKKGA